MTCAAIYCEFTLLLCTYIIRQDDLRTIRSSDHKSLFFRINQDNNNHLILSKKNVEKS